MRMNKFPDLQKYIFVWKRFCKITFSVTDTYSQEFASLNSDDVWLGIHDTIPGKRWQSIVSDVDILSLPLNQLTGFVFLCIISCFYLQNKSIFSLIDFCLLLLLGELSYFQGKQLKNSLSQILFGVFF